MKVLLDGGAAVDAVDQVSVDMCVFDDVDVVVTCAEGSYCTACCGC